MALETLNNLSDPQSRLSAAADCAVKASEEIQSWSKHPRILSSSEPRFLMIAWSSMGRALTQIGHISEITITQAGVG